MTFVMDHAHHGVSVSVPRSGQDEEHLCQKKNFSSK